MWAPDEDRCCKVIPRYLRIEYNKVLFIWSILTDHSSLHEQGIEKKSRSKERELCEIYGCMYSLRDHTQVEWDLQNYWLNNFPQHVYVCM